MSHDPRVLFTIRLAEALHRYGTPTHRLEETMGNVMARIGLRGRFFSIPTGIFASFEEPEDHKTSIIRVSSADVNLEKLCDLDALGDQVIDGQVGVSEGIQRIGAIVDAKARWRSRHMLGGFAFSSATASCFFNGGWREFVVSGLIGFVVGVVAAEVGNRPSTRQISPIVAATLASALATLAPHVLPPVNVYTSTLAGLIMLIPGLTLTTAITELATGNLVSGTARLTGGALTFLELGFGVALGGQIARLLPEVPMMMSAPFPAWTIWLALVAAPAGFTVVMRARPGDAVWISGASILAFAGARVGSLLLGSELGALLGAVTLGVAANLFARYVKRPAAVVLLPGLILLVPGSIGFVSLSRFIANDAVTGVGAAFSVALVATAIATGLLVANALVPPRRNL